MKARLIASVVLAASVVLGTSACNLVAPQATTKHYDPSDGVSGRVGDMKIRNAMIITGEDGTDGNLVASVTNGGDPQSLSIQFGEGAGDTVTEDIPVRSTVSFGTDEEDPILLEGIDAEPGSMVEVFFQYGDETGVEILVPVLDGELGEYSTLVPTEPAE
ncbi:DNA modification methylase [Mycetocola sp. 2940]|uniref:DNA modification methylase n=1 Tax=Mycetocola sp. 2940 TaxID=3156452 RepID=UPI00339B706B